MLSILAPEVGGEMSRVVRVYGVALAIVVMGLLESCGAASAPSTPDTSSSTSPDTFAEGDGMTSETDAHEITPTECVDLCADIFGALSEEEAEAACLDESTCLAICAGVASAETPLCRMSAGALEQCLRPRAVEACSSQWEVFFQPGCIPLVGCFFLEPSETLLSDLYVPSAMLLCDAVERLARPTVLDEESYRSGITACVQGFQAQACACRSEMSEETEDECAATLSEALTCLTSASTAASAAPSRCGPFAAPLEDIGGDERLLLELDCGEVRRLCQDALPAQGILPEDQGCQRNGPEFADYDNPVETCAAAAEALRCHCALDAEQEGCSMTVGDLRDCVADSEDNGCCYLGDGSCISPRNASSGLATDVLVSQAEETVLEQWCAWRQCLAGGAGFTPYGCLFPTPAAFAVTPEECVADLQRHFASCAVTLRDLENCVQGMMINDACERLATFGGCTSMRDEDPVSAYVPCHYLLADGCESVVTCLEEEWGVSFVEPEGY